ncbi:helix-turn-helix domain-containing protein [Streptomyces virginiae]|uniref:helix-turn-helix domain-containing protein n=1 Tax=Streptomyces virginiae TaxID=1961 RepID=UPI0036C3B5D4
MVTPSRITLARKRRGLTLAELSELAGVSLQSLSNYETGRTAPRRATVERLAGASGELGVVGRTLSCSDGLSVPRRGAERFRQLPL